MNAVYARLRGRDIYNACSPAWQWEISEQFRERWWSDEFADLRDLMVGWFIELFELHTGGHYSKLRESVLKNGFLNPIIVTSGAPLRREPWQVPNYPQQYICEQNGGSRLMLAQELDLELPCIINGKAPGEALRSMSEVRSKFRDQSYHVYFDPKQGVMSNPTNLLHLGHFGMSENKAAVRKSKDEIIRRATRWLDERGIAA